jgi:hypothetical protein
MEREYLEDLGITRKVIWKPIFEKLFVSERDIC